MKSYITALLVAISAALGLAGEASPVLTPEQQARFDRFQISF